MRLATALIGALGLLAAAASANAAPPVPDLYKTSNIIQVADGCGPGLHATPWGRCVPNRTGFNRDFPNRMGFNGEYRYQDRDYRYQDRSFYPHTGGGFPYRERERSWYGD